MKKLILVRHGKSSWDFPVKDIGRDLIEKGIQNSIAVAKSSINLIDSNIVFWSSNATRANKTAQLFLENWNISQQKLTIKPSDAGAAPDARGIARPAGTQCADCHSDPHAGQFASAGRTECAACHATEPDFMALDFDHQVDARFALDATHARLDCAACHVRWPLPGGGSAVRYKPLVVECGDCHAAGGGTPR